MAVSIEGPGPAAYNTEKARSVKHQPRRNLPVACDRRRGKRPTATALAMGLDYTHCLTTVCPVLDPIAGT